MAVRIKQMNPKNVASTWNQDANWWNSFGICPAQLFVGGGGFSAGSKIGIGGGWLSGIVAPHYSCGSDAYVSQSGTDISIDVWRALADGLWSSSVVFSIYRAAGGVLSAATVYARPNSLVPSPPAQSNSYTLSSAAACPSVLVTTVTVFDDGTFTLV